MVEGTIESSGTAGQILARAWGKVHAFTPDDSGAYANAVRAVEAAAKPLVEPNNEDATLGGMASVIRNQGRLAPPVARASARSDRRHDRGDDAVVVPRTRGPSWARRLPRRHARGDTGGRRAGSDPRRLVRIGHCDAPPGRGLSVAGVPREDGLAKRGQRTEGRFFSPDPLGWSSRPRHG